MCRGECKAQVHFQAFDLVINSLVFSYNPEPTLSPTTPQSTESLPMHLDLLVFAHSLRQQQVDCSSQPHSTGLPLLCSEHGEAQACTKLKQHGSTQLSSPLLAL